MQKTLETDDIIIFADNREFPSGVVKSLALMDCIVKPKQLDVGDYICSDRVGIERKSTSDFLSSIVDSRLFDQVKSLSESYPNPLMILEGDVEELYTKRNIHPNAINGALSSISIDYRIPILWSMDTEHTAALIFTIAKREQVKEGRAVAIRGEKRVFSTPQQQEFLVAGLPNVSTVLAKRLLDEFGTVKDTFNASQENLTNIEGIGEKKAKNIIDILHAKYKPRK